MNKGNLKSGMILLLFNFSCMKKTVNNRVASQNENPKLGKQVTSAGEIPKQNSAMAMPLEPVLPIDAKAASGLLLGAASNCLIALPYCENGALTPQFLYDSWDGSNQDPEICRRRAHDYWVYCGNGASQPVHAWFHDGSGACTAWNTVPALEPAVPPVGQPAYKKSTNFSVSVFDGSTWFPSHTWEDFRQSTTPWFEGSQPQVLAVFKKRPKMVVIA